MLRLASALAGRQLCVKPGRATDEASLGAVCTWRSRCYLQLHYSENPKAAVHVDEEIARAVRRLLDFPESGRPGRIEGTRELVVPRTPYIAAYMVMADRIRILPILHGAQIWPFEYGDE